MGSALGPNGSTTRWRRIRALVLARDGFACQAPLADGQRCGAHATVAGHIIARAEWPPGMPGVDGGGNLRAECARHSHSGGAFLKRDLDRRARGDSRRLAELEQHVDARGAFAAVMAPMGTPTARDPDVPLDAVPEEEEPAVF